MNMADMMHIPVLGLVENMSYITCPDCGKKISLFGESHAQETAEKHNLKVLGSLPLDVRLAAACDAGLVELFDGNWLDDAVKLIMK